MGSAASQQPANRSDAPCTGRSPPRAPRVPRTIHRNSAWSWARTCRRARRRGELRTCLGGPTDACVVTSLGPACCDDSRQAHASHTARNAEGIAFIRAMQPPCPIVTLHDRGTVLAGVARSPPRPGSLPVSANTAIQRVATPATESTKKTALIAIANTMFCRSTAPVLRLSRTSSGSLRRSSCVAQLVRRVDRGVRSGRAHREADRRLGERGGVVDAIADHSDFAIPRDQAVDRGDLVGRHHVRPGPR